MKRENIPVLYQVGYRCFYVLLLYVMCLLTAGKLFGIDTIDIWDPVFAVFVLIGLAGMDYGRLKGKTLGILLVILLLFIIGMISGADSLWEFFDNYGKWLTGENGWQEEWCFAYELVQSGLLITICYPMEILLEQIPLLKYMSAVAAVVFLLADMVQKREVSQFTVAVFLWYVLLCFVEGTRRYWKKKKGDTHRSYLLQLLPFCGVYLLLLCRMPAPEEPYDWKAFKNAYHNIYEKVNVLIQELQRGDEEDFAVVQIGFSGSGRLLSGLTQEKRELLTVKGNAGLKTNVYLTGKIYDTFDGSTWSQTIETKENHRWIDTLETLYAIRRHEEALLEDYVYNTGLSVRYEYFDTGYLFVPLKCKRIEGCEYQVSGDDLVFSGQKGYGTEYTAAYFQMNAGHPGFEQMLATEIPENEQLFDLTVQSYTPEGRDAVSFEELLQYRDIVQEDYGQEIILTQQTEQYLAEITKDAQNQMERLRAIEADLASFTYTTDPGRLPERIDSEAEFLEYFLLENPKGYCSYFATAFVLIARAEGLPARYVEGFCVPLNAKREMTVTDDMVHAWPEVYMEGVGWIPFEPTPGYREIRYTPWKTKSEKESNAPVTFMEPEEEWEFIEEEVQEMEAITEETDDRVIKVLVFAGLFAGVGILLVVLSDMLIRAGRYHRMTMGEQFFAEIKRILWLLAGLGYVRAENETIAQLQQKAREGLEEPTFLCALSDFEAYRYGGYEVTEDMLAVAKQERNKLLLYVKQKRKLYYYLALIRLGIIERKSDRKQKMER